MHCGVGKGRALGRRMTLGKKHGHGSEVCTSIADIPGPGHEL